MARGMCVDTVPSPSPQFCELQKQQWKEGYANQKSCVTIQQYTLEAMQLVTAIHYLFFLLVSARRHEDLPKIVHVSNDDMFSHSRSSSGGVSINSTRDLQASVASPLQQ